MTSASCTSSVASHKLSPKSQPDSRSKSCDTNCTSNSSCFFKRRKPANPLAYPMRPAYHKTNNPVKQRVMSAKLLKVRQLQSQLNDANFHLAEVARENQTLKTLQKRQDKALNKYENTNADLPRLIHSHEEEIRALTERNKSFKKSVRELTEQLKQKEEELNKTREQLTHLEKLNKDKHLTEREKLTDQMEDYKVKLQKSEEQVTTLTRKLLLESKTSKHRLNTEILRYKQCQKELLHAFDEIDRLTGLLDAKENMIRPRNPRFEKFHSKGSVSMGTLKHYNQPTRNLSSEKLNSQTPVTDVKLEPIMNGKTGKDIDKLQRKNQNGFKAPMENIIQRLSTGSTRAVEDLNGLSNHSSDLLTESRDTSAGSFKSRPTSSMKLEKLPFVQENQRIRTKMKYENDVKEYGDHKQQSEQNMGVSNEENHSDEEELVEDKDIIVRYDYQRDRELQPPNGILRHKLSDNKDECSKKDSKVVGESSDQSGNSSEGELVDIIQKMKKDKHTEEKLLLKPQQRKRSSDDDSTTGSTQSERDIEKMAETLDAAIQRAAQNSKEDFDKNLSNYCSDVLNNVNSCSKAIEIHKDNLKYSKEDSETLLKTLQKTEKIETQLKNSFFNMDDDMDFVKEILNEEHKFRMESKVQKSSTRDQNSNTQKKALVNLESKKKLLATLRAIDNGDSVESMEEPKQGNVIKEIFGNVAH